MKSGFFRSSAAWTAAFIGACMLCAGLAGAAPRAELWPRWTAHDESSAQSVDHGPWTAFLERYVVKFPDGVNRVRYASVSSDDRARLGKYIDTLASTDITRYSRVEQRAFWINLYNALTVRLIIDHRPVSSIRDIDISPGLFAFGPWDKKLIKVEGEELSLNDIEHRILRPIWKDPRIHYGVNCASIGCPDLMPVAYTAENTERLLDEGARTYVNHPRGVSAKNGELVVSSIYHWFREDFGGSEAGVLEHLRRFANHDTRALLDRYGEIGAHRYDWSLNDAQPAG